MKNLLCACIQYKFTHKITIEFVHIAVVRQQQIIMFFDHDTVEIKSVQQDSVRKSN